MKQKTFRVSLEVERKFQELKGVYHARSENHLWELIVNDIYELKKAKALVPYEELSRTTQELQKAMFQMGRMQGILEKEREEKVKLLQEIEQLKKQKQKKGFWAKLLGGIAS